MELYNNSDQSVDLSGWAIDDEGSPDKIGKDAYIFPIGATVPARSYFVVNLPPETFALNNTGGDTVRLFWPDKTLVKSVSYTGSAKEDQSYASKTNDIYNWTTLVTKGVANQFPKASLAAGLSSEAETKIRLNEIFPNPKGPDSGAEWIEVTNTGTEPIYLHNWILDDGDISGNIGSSAYKIQSPIVYPGGLAVLLIPAGKFAMNNVGSDTIRLFNENKILIDSISYQDAQEDFSYALVNGKWVWTTPSPDALNDLASLPEQKDSAVNIVINEIFPEPAHGSQQEEFIELFNPSATSVDLSGFKISDSVSSYKLSSSINAGGFLVIKKSDSNISLNNSGKESITLTDPKGAVLASLEYEDAPKDESYNLTPDGIYVWSKTITPGAVNLVGKSGQVLGAILLPRTGDDSGFNMWDGFALWVIVWYIYVKLTKGKEPEYEQTRVG